MPPRYGAWRFLLPAESEAEDGLFPAGLQISPTGGIDLVHEDASVRQAILLLLSTAPGERVMRPDYGCELNRLVFSPNDDTTAGLAIHFVRKALLRFEPRIDILRLDAGQGLGAQGPEDATAPPPPRLIDQGAVLDISLEYRVRATQRTDRLLFSFSLAGGQR